MKTYPFARIGLILFSALLLFYCASSSGGIGGTGFVSRGTISAFGSLVVNGNELDTSRAVIIVSGQNVGTGDGVAQDYLDIGMVVTVEGRQNTKTDTAVASRVRYNQNIAGPVEDIRDIDVITREILVLGQTVIVNTVTQFKETTFDTIALDDVVAVSGLVDDTGTLWATFFEKTAEFIPGSTVEVVGLVANLDTDLESFEINDLVIDYSMADTGGLPGGVPVEGQMVEVEGRLDAAGGQLFATEIKLSDELGIEDAYAMEVTGFVTNFVSADEFTIDQQLVQTSAQTLYVDGEPADIALGVRLEAEGRLVEGILYASEIEFWQPDQIEVEGIVTDIASVSEFTVGNQVVQTDAATVFEDGTPDDIVLGVLIEVKGVPIDIERSVILADKVSFE
jgi:hypothetical protein